ncbi:hypothetical protein JMG10_29820 [Nostoc ellipsosporum NOK]|nr:hypothetical protein [Sphingomonas sp. IBVSS2]MDF2385701.1 hypothetical protein [Nostoc ellipsosporum NOK]OSZ65057.1 hypothetical protein CAP40_14665 [Sphingomonas sp. IBVSS2]
MGLALAVAAAGGAAGDVALRPMVEVRSAQLRVGDLVAAREGALPARVADLVVARLPHGATALALPARDIAALVRRRVPGLRVSAPAGEMVRIRATIAALPARVGGSCFAAAAALPAGAAVKAGDVIAAECRGTMPAALRYDRDGLAVTRAALPAGAYLGRLATLPRDAIGKGTPLTLRSAAGPVTVERAVTTMQSGRSGARLFVRDGEGKVFAAPLALVDKEGGR